MRFDRLRPLPRFLGLLLAGLLAALPARAVRAESLDWMPANDAIGFWGAKLPAPDGAKEWFVGRFHKNAEGHLLVFYAYKHKEAEHDVYYDLSSNTIVLHVSSRNSMEEKKNAKVLNAFEKTLKSALADDQIVTANTGLAKNIDNKCHTPSYNPPVDCGFTYAIGTQTFAKALLIQLPKKTRFDCGGPRSWNDYRGCVGKIRFVSPYLGFHQLKDDDTLVADTMDMGFIIRFKNDMTSPFIAQRDDMAIVDFPEMVARYQDALEAVLQSEKKGNLLEDTEATVAPYFLELIRNKEQR